MCACVSVGGAAANDVNRRPKKKSAGIDKIKHENRTHSVESVALNKIAT